MAKNNRIATSKRFVINKKYRFRQDYSDTSLGKIPQGITVTFISNCAGCAKFKLPNGKQVTIQEKTANTIVEMH
jgi:hypothetical protein